MGNGGKNNGGDCFANGGDNIDSVQCSGNSSGNNNNNNDDGVGSQVVIDDIIGRYAIVNNDINTRGCRSVPVAATEVVVAVVITMQ